MAMIWYQKLKEVASIASGEIFTMEEYWAKLGQKLQQKINSKWELIINHQYFASNF